MQMLYLLLSFIIIFIVCLVNLTCLHTFSSGVPSGPRNVISIVNETSVTLEWHSHARRVAVMMSCIILFVRNARRTVAPALIVTIMWSFSPPGLTECRVFISNLLAHTLYTFEIQAVNGVTNKSPYPAQHVSIDITTNQAGK